MHFLVRLLQMQCRCLCIGTTIEDLLIRTMGFATYCRPKTLILTAFFGEVNTGQKYQGRHIGKSAKILGETRYSLSPILEAGDNTLNRNSLLSCTVTVYCTEVLTRTLPKGMEVMLTPGWHQDTYAEEYHRAFFDNYSSGNPTFLRHL